MNTNPSLPDFCRHIAAQPHPSTNLSQLLAHSTSYPLRWETAFRFLAQVCPLSPTTENTLQLTDGRIDLDHGVYVNIDHYIPKAIQQCRGEAHQRYIDVQYVVSGEEYIGLTHDTSLPILQPYDAEKDIIFYDFHPTPSQLLLADCSHFFIFFPSDIHAPSLCTNSHPTPVTKLVIKIPY